MPRKLGADAGLRTTVVTALSLLQESPKSWKKVNTAHFSKSKDPLKSLDAQMLAPVATGK